MTGMTSTDVNHFRRLRKAGSKRRKWFTSVDVIPVKFLYGPSVQKLLLPPPLMRLSNHETIVPILDWRYGVDIDLIQLSWKKDNELVTLFRSSKRKNDLNIFTTRHSKRRAPFCEKQILFDHILIHYVNRVYRNMNIRDGHGTTKTKEKHRNTEYQNWSKPCRSRSKSSQTKRNAVHPVSLRPSVHYWITLQEFSNFRILSHEGSLAVLSSSFGSRSACIFYLWFSFNSLSASSSAGKRLAGLIIKEEVSSSSTE